MKFLLMTAVIASTAVYSTSAANLSLRNGSRIQAPVLKQDKQHIVLDLGCSIISIPATEVLSILDDTNATQQPVTTNDYYSIANLAQMTTAEAAAKYGDAVVVVKSPHGLGSGFFINKKGYLVTNFHVIKGSRHLTVTRFKKEGSALKRIIYRDVEIIATAPFHDLAVLKINGFKGKLTTVVLAPSDDVAIGEPVFAIGNPLGLERSVSEGVISQAERNFKGVLYHQVDAPINPGNSGGPLFNSHGEVIGVINMGSATFEGLNFAIPVQHVKYVLDHLTGFAFDQSNPESGFVYPEPPPRPAKTTNALKIDNQKNNKNQPKEINHETKVTNSTGRRPADSLHT